MEALSHGWTVSMDKQTGCYLFTKDNHRMSPTELEHIKEHGFSKKFLQTMTNTKMKKK